MAERKKRPQFSTVRERLPKYLRYIEAMEEQGNKVMSIPGLSKEMGYAQQKIILDFFYSGIKGKRRVGYKTKDLKKGVYKITGLDNPHTAVIIGVNPITGLFLAHPEFKKYNLTILDIFDHNPENIGKNIGGYIVKNLETSFPDHVDIVIVADLYESWQNVQEYMDKIFLKDIKLVWDFNLIKVKCPDNILYVNSDIIVDYILVTQKLAMKDFDDFCLDS